MRELSQFTADVRTHLFQQLASGSGSPLARNTDGELWPTSALDDIDIQIRQSGDAREKELWESVRAGLVALARATTSAPDKIPDLVREAEQDLRELRDHYDLSQYRSMVETAQGSLLAQAAIGLACMLTVLLFLIYLLIVRHWLIQPIQVLKDSAETIGQGRLDHRVPLSGSDELSQLARSIDAMAEGLARYQTDLVRTREMSALGELCANLAHGLRNPLAAIRSTAQLAERRAQTEDQRQALRDLSAQADRMDQRITTLFAFSRPVDLQYRPSLFAEIAGGAQAQALPLLKTRGVSVQVDDQTQGRHFEVDCDLLAQAVSELLTNAAHHSPGGALIRMCGQCITSNGRDVLQITVEDSGTGMSEATLHKAFDLFFTSRPDGTGVGLTLVHRIVERHGGKIEIVSQRGAGTRLTLQIPDRASGENDSSRPRPREEDNGHRSARHS
jgi:signal transduction histidine kinase